MDFAAKYTGLQDSVTAQLSLIKLQLHRHSVATLLHFFMRLKPSLDRYALLLLGRAPSSQHVGCMFVKTTARKVCGTLYVLVLGYLASARCVEISLADCTRE